MNQNFKSIIHNYFLKMSHFNYLFFAIALFIIGIFGYLGLTKYSKSHAFGFEQPMQCDTTEKAEFSLFDLSILLRKNINSKSFSERSFVVYEKDSLEVLKLVFNWSNITNHLIIPNEKKFARTVLNEIQYLTIFPKSGSSQQIRYVLKTYFGFKDKQITKILNLDSRWVRISKSYPMYILYDKGAYIMN